MTNESSFYHTSSNEFIGFHWRACEGFLTGSWGDTKQLDSSMGDPITASMTTSPSLSQSSPKAAYNLGRVAYDWLGGVAGPMTTHLILLGDVLV